MLAPSATAQTPFLTSWMAASSSSSFWVAQGSAMSHSTSQMLPSVMYRAEGRWAK